MDMGRKLWAAAVEPKDVRYFPNAGHNDLYDQGADDAILDFLKGVFP